MDETTAGIRVFVYGSLKQGRGNASALDAATLLGRCVLRGNYALLNLGWYPGLVMDKGLNGAVLGEVYRINKETLDLLDMIEGHPNYYRRTKVLTPWKGAWAYFLPEDYLGQRPVVEPSVADVSIWQPTDDEVSYVSALA